MDAAAELFTGAGYAATTTRAIAERAGLRQASLYYHFPAKEDLLAALLAETVRPSLDVARALLKVDAPASTRLWALSYSDIHLLGGGPHNLGALYLLPEISSPGLADFRAERFELKDAYRALIGGAAALTDLVFGLVESTALVRRDTPDVDIEAHARHGADAVLRITGTEPGAMLHAAALRLLKDS